MESNQDKKTTRAVAIIYDRLGQFDPECDSTDCQSVGVALLGLQEAQNICHDLAKFSGWWTGKNGDPIARDTPYLISNKLCLIHSEISEAMEGDRKDLMDDKLPHRKMLEVELGDAIIRAFDLAGFLGLDLASAIIEKLAYNQQRADHKPENRQAEGGKSY